MRECESGRVPSGRSRIIAVEGPIGVGKTTLAKKLAAAYGTDLLLEGASENPFLAKFYADPVRFALPAQLHFLFQRVEQLQRIRQNDLFRSTYVSDYMLEKDRLFARLTLDPAEYDIYERTYARIVHGVAQPDLIIYLQADITTLLERIARRGLAYERGIDRTYLDRLCGAYVSFFKDYDAVPVLIVNTNGLNFADADDAFDELLKKIAEGVPHKQYYEPGPKLYEPE